MHTHWCLTVDTPIRFKYYKKAKGKFICLQNGQCQRKRERKTWRSDRTCTKKKTTKFRQGQGPAAWICGGTFYSLTILCTAHITFLRTVHVIFTIYRPTVYWSTQCDLLLYFREFCKWMRRKSCMSPTFHQYAKFTVQYFPPYSLLLTVRDYVEFFSTWRWKVYDLWPYVQMPLIQAMKEACDQIEAASMDSSLKKIPPMLPCKWKYSIIYDVYEALWPEPAWRRNV